MENDKKVLKNTESAEKLTNGIDVNGNSGKKVTNKEVDATPIEIDSEIKEQNLYKSTSLEVAEVNPIIANSPEILALEKMRYFAKEVIKSGVSSFKREADVIVVLQRGFELGLPYGVSVNNIFPIGGKTGMSVHLHKALLENAGVYFELREDNVPIYYFGKMNTSNQFVPIGKTDKLELPGYIVNPAQIDSRTTYYFERTLKDKLTNEIRKKQLTMSYYYSEAVMAGLTDKDVWVKYRRALMKARAFTMGASEIASDVVQGMYSINELAMEFGKKFSIDENLQETFEDTAHEVIE